jgi:alpha-methylacyl-CoA racemase
MTEARKRSGPLTGLRVLEIAAIGPVPFCGMLLSDLGADVVRIDRKDAPPYPAHAVTFRGRRSVALDLKNPAAVAICLRLTERADALIEGFRPGVMERLGLGPAQVAARNPKLVYGRMTGWGQSGMYAQLAGHDIDYIAMSGALHAIGTAEQPAIPINLIGDYGGGTLYLAFGLMAAVLHARATGEGQVIDCAMTDGAVSLMNHVYGNFAGGEWRDARARNIVDGGSHFYNVYQCADGKWLALGAIESRFYAQLLRKLGIEDPAFDAQMDQARWAELKGKVAVLIRTRSRDEWCRMVGDSDACVAPVLSLSEAPEHPYHRERGTFVDVAGVRQAAPAPRFSRTPGSIQGPPAGIGEHSDEVLTEWGFETSELRALKASGVI